VGEGDTALDCMPVSIQMTLLQGFAVSEKCLRAAPFLNCASFSGCPLINEGCAYISVSGPRRTLQKPYFREKNEVRS
jgi:hypothetical protein